MKLGTRTRHGARAMLALTLDDEAENGVVSVRELAARQQISPRYLEHLSSVQPAPDSAT
jgi:DNA-binding IscR family transcriptional regulator